MTQRITDLPPDELERFCMLSPRIFGDYRNPTRGPFRMAFIYANTIDNEGCNFLRAIELENAGAINSLGVSEGSLGFGYEGFAHSLERLRYLGWRDTVPIVKIDVGGQVNTGTEAQKLVEYIDQHFAVGDDLAVIAPHFHIERAFTTTVTALKRNNVSVRAYAVPGAPLNWTQVAKHSLGIVEGKRADLLKGELQRREKYRALECGSMATAQDVIDYLDWRDS
ncbi:MAG: hypothetical protein WAZ27_02740 [Minisyncoccia bacterium]